ncbi:hypothetical protein BKA57DRAFT_453791 [Linnemannia elongata]|nr:hypothetical protein BKA57DRAFT_453791 [Linnemannia elongata]
MCVYLFVFFTLYYSRCLCCSCHPNDLPDRVSLLSCHRQVNANLSLKPDTSPVSRPLSLSLPERGGQQSLTHKQRK